MNPVSSTYFCTITSSEEDTSMDPTEKDGIFIRNHYGCAALKKEFQNITYGRLPKLPYENESFDLIHSSHLVEHLQP